ncbi:MAG: hypothetical protein ACE5H4_06550 [Candidatus Thorarchaeota archaeon]
MIQSVFPSWSGGQKPNHNCPTRASIKFRTVQEEKRLDTYPVKNCPA